jgi:hypothetical protein
MRQIDILTELFEMQSEIRRHKDIGIASVMDVLDGVDITPEDHRLLRKVILDNFNDFCRYCLMKMFGIEVENGR